MLIGLIAGMISVVGFTMIQPRLEKLTGGIDSCGVHNLHGMTGVFGGLIAVLIVSSPTWQLTGVIFTVIFAIIMGVVVGFTTSKLAKKENITDDTKEFFSE
jgi:ammonium transporter Rh